MKPRNAGPALFLVIFGGVFGLLGLLMLSIVLTSVLGDEGLLAANGVPLAIAGIFLGAAAWIFGTALRLPFRAHPLGEPEVTLVPDAGEAGELLALCVRLILPKRVALEEAFADLTCVEIDVRNSMRAKSTHSILHTERFPLAIREIADPPIANGSPSAVCSPITELAAGIRIPVNAAPTLSREDRHRAWSLRISIATASAPDWTAELPVTVR